MHASKKQKVTAVFKLLSNISLKLTDGRLISFSEFENEYPESNFPINVEWKELDKKSGYEYLCITANKDVRAIILENESKDTVSLGIGVKLDAPKIDIRSEFEFDRLKTNSNVFVLHNRCKANLIDIVADKKLSIWQKGLLQSKNATFDSNWISVYGTVDVKDQLYVICLGLSIMPMAVFKAGTRIINAVGHTNLLGVERYFSSDETTLCDLNLGLYFPASPGAVTNLFHLGKVLSIGTQVVRQAGLPFAAIINFAYRVFMFGVLVFNILKNIKWTITNDDTEKNTLYSAIRNLYSKPRLRYVLSTGVQATNTCIAAQEMGNSFSDLYDPHAFDSLKNKISWQDFAAFVAPYRNSFNAISLQAVEYGVNSNATSTLHVSGASAYYKKQLNSPYAVNLLYEGTNDLFVDSQDYRLYGMFDVGSAVISTGGMQIANYCRFGVENLTLRASDTIIFPLTVKINTADITSQKDIAFVEGSRVGINRASIRAANVTNNAAFTTSEADVFASEAFVNTAEIKASNFFRVTSQTAHSSGAVDAPQLVMLGDKSIKVSGKLNGSDVLLEGNDIFVQNAALTAQSTLRFISLLTTIESSMIHSPNLDISAVILLGSLNRIYAYNFIDRAILNGMALNLILPSIPNQLSDVFSASKVVTIGSSVLQTVFPPAAVAVNLVSKLYTLGLSASDIKNIVRDIYVNGYDNVRLRKLVTPTISAASFARSAKSLYQEASSFQSLNELLEKPKVDFDAKSQAYNAFSLLAPHRHSQNVFNVESNFEFGGSLNAERLFSFNSGLTAFCGSSIETGMYAYNFGLRVFGSVVSSYRYHNNSGVFVLPNSVVVGQEVDNKGTIFSWNTSWQAKKTKNSGMIFGKSSVFSFGELKSSDTMQLEKSSLYSDTAEISGEFFTQDSRIEVKDMKVNKALWEYKGKNHVVTDKYYDSSDSSLVPVDSDAIFILEAKSPDLNAEHNASNIFYFLSGIDSKEAIDLANGAGKYQRINATGIFHLQTECPVTVSPKVTRKDLSLRSKGLSILPGDYDFESASLVSYGEGCDTHALPGVKFKVKKRTILASEEGKVHLEGAAERVGTNDRYKEVAVFSTFDSEEGIDVFAGTKALFQGTKLKSKQTDVQAGVIEDRPIELHEHHYDYHNDGRFESSVTEHKVTHHVSSYEIEDKLSLKSEGSTLMEGSSISAEQFRLESGEDPTLVGTNSTRTRHEVIVETNRRRFRGTKRTTTNNNYADSVHNPMALDVSGTREIVSGGHVTLELPTMPTTGGQLSVKGSTVGIYPGINSHGSSLNRHSNGKFAQSGRADGGRLDTVAPFTINSPIVVDAETTNIHVPNEGSAPYASLIQTSGAVNHVKFDLENTHYCYSSRVPTPALSALIGIGVGVATLGTGSVIGPALKFGETTSVMLAAGFSSLCADATLALANNRGNPEASIGALANSNTVKHLATSMLSAGLLHQASEAMNLPKAWEAKTFQEHLKYNIARTAIDASLSMAIYDTKPKDAIGHAILDTVVSTLSGTTATKIADSDAGRGTQVLAHTLSATAAGAVLDGERGAISSAIGALTVQALIDKEELTSKLDESATREQRQEEYTQRKQQANKSKLAAATVAFMANQDVSQAARSADNILDNDYLVEQVVETPGYVAGSSPEEEVDDDLGLADLFTEDFDNSPGPSTQQPQLVSDDEIIEVSGTPELSEFDKMLVALGYMEGIRKKTALAVLDVALSPGRAQEYADPLINPGASMFTTESLEDQVMRERGYIDNANHDAVVNFVKHPIDSTAMVVKNHWERRTEAFNANIAEGRFFTAGYDAAGADFVYVEAGATVLTLAYAGGVGTARAYSRLTRAPKPGSLVPMYDAVVMDFAPTGFKNGDFYSPRKLRQLYEYLQKRGADIQPIPLGAKGPGFRASDPRTGKPTLYLPENPTVLEVKHELSHYLDMKKLGIETYTSLSTLEKEQMVLDRLQKNRVWEQLTELERDFSKGYVKDIRADSMPRNINGGPKIE